MTLNLANHRWIPVRRRDGPREWISPWQLTDSFGENPVVAFDWPRADFNGASHEFMIGLLATTFAQRTLDEWLRRWFDPPSPDELRKAFESVAFAFDLDGDGPRFMQELGEFEKRSQRSIASLLIDYPGEQSLERNADHFVKRGGISAVSRASAAIALYTVQTYSPAGGRGFLTSMRGGGPLTTIVAADPAPETGPNASRATLWDRLWPNVPDRKWPDWERTPHRVFPWLASTRSAKTSPATTPEHGHSLQAYWGMPRRVRLVFESANGRRCDLAGTDDEVVAVAWQTKQYGIKYEGWIHPLSPYFKKTGEKPSATKGRPGGVSYRHWLGLIQEDIDNGRHPAECVTAFRASDGRLEAAERVRLIAFGYDMDNMKARSWYQSEMPIPRIKGNREAFEAVARRLVRSADQAARLVRNAVKSALFERPGDAAGDFYHVKDRFWRETESMFFERLALLANDEADDVAIRMGWQRILRSAALAIFDDTVPSDGIEAGSWKRIVTARQWLIRSLDGKPIYEKLDLGRPRRDASSGAPP